jgi:hypothetical protein
VDYTRTIAFALSSTTKNNSLRLAIAVPAFGGLAILPPSLLPLFQVPLMHFLRNSHHVSRACTSEAFPSKKTAADTFQAKKVRVPVRILIWNYI